MPWPLTGKRRSRLGVTAISPSLASPERSSRRFSGFSAATMATEGPPQYDSKKRLLVVDDHEDNVEVLRARLEARGYEVRGANDGQTALDIVEHWIPDLIL